MNMTIKWAFQLICALLLLQSSQIKAQIRTRGVKLEIKGNHGDFSSFDSVIVINNGVNSPIVYDSLDGKYPPFVLTADTMAFKQYLIKRMAGRQPVRSTLLINILQIRVPNRDLPYYVKKGKKKKIRYLRNYLIFDANIYIREFPDSLLKEIKIRKPYPLDYKSVDDVIATALDEVLVYASNVVVDKKSNGDFVMGFPIFLDESKQILFAEDSVKYNLDSMGVYGGLHQKEYPIFRANHFNKGLFRNFEDFRKDAILSLPFTLKAVSDSVFQIDKPSNDLFERGELPWALFDNGNMYLQVSKNIYLKFFKGQKTFFFEVPYSCPDLYSLLSINEINRTIHVSPTITANPIANIVDHFLSQFLERELEKAEKKKIMQNMPKLAYRKGYIDMNYGDIIYCN